MPYYAGLRRLDLPPDTPNDAGTFPLFRRRCSTHGHFDSTSQTNPCPLCKAEVGLDRILAWLERAHEEMGDETTRELVDKRRAEIGLD